MVDEPSHALVYVGGSSELRTGIVTTFVSGALISDGDGNTAGDHLGELLTVRLYKRPARVWQTIGECLTDASEPSNYAGLSLLGAVMPRGIRCGSVRVMDSGRK